MKLEYKVFHTYGVGPFPVDMIRYDPAFYNQRHENTVVMIQLPGTLKTIMNGTPARWESFGWIITEAMRPQDVKNDIMKHLSEWWTITHNDIGYTLEDFANAKNMNDLQKYKKQIPDWLKEM